MYTQANLAINDEDEELAYVYLMKYFALINYLQQAKDFKKEEQFIRKLLGKNTDIKARMDRLQSIQQSLIKRYDEKRRESTTTSSPTITPNNNNVVPPISTGNVNERSSEPIVHQKSIECDDLYQLMKDPRVSLLVVDCRHSDEFEGSHLKYKNLLNVPEQVIKKG